MVTEFNYYWSKAWVPIFPPQIYILFRFTIVCHNLGTSTTDSHCCCCYLWCLGATKCLMLLTNALAGSWPIVMLDQVQDWDYCGPIMPLLSLSSHRTWLKEVSKNLPNSCQKRWKRYKENCWWFSSMSTKFFENQKKENLRKNRKTFSLTDSLKCGTISFFFLVSLPLCPFIGHLPGCVVYQGQFAEIIASLQRSNGPFAMYHNVNGAFE